MRCAARTDPPTLWLWLLPSGWVDCGCDASDIKLNVKVTQYIHSALDATPSANHILTVHRGGFFAFLWNIYLFAKFKYYINSCWVCKHTMGKSKIIFSSRWCGKQWAASIASFLVPMHRTRPTSEIQHIGMFRWRKDYLIVFRNSSCNKPNGCHIATCQIHSHPHTSLASS